MQPCGLHKTPLSADISLVYTTRMLQAPGCPLAFDHPGHRLVHNARCAYGTQRTAIRNRTPEPGSGTGPVPLPLCGHTLIPQLEPGHPPPRQAVSGAACPSPWSWSPPPCCWCWTSPHRGWTAGRQQTCCAPARRYAGAGRAARAQAEACVGPSPGAFPRTLSVPDAGRWPARGSDWVPRVYPAYFFLLLAERPPLPSVTGRLCFSQHAYPARIHSQPC